MITHHLFLFSSLLLTLCYANIIDDATKKGECEGSVTLYEGSEETVVTEDQNVKVTVDKVKVEGCGCFSLHSKKGGKGRSFFLGKRGDHSAKNVGWNKVKSIRKVSCENRAMPVWGVIVIVVGLVILMALVAVFGFRKYREYSAVKTEENSSANM